ncbi:MAG: hypothetical protein AAF433_13315 [Bacteroidota bacterium]
MDPQDQLQYTADLLRQDFALAGTETEEIDEARLIQLLADEVDHLMQHKMDWLMSLLYRLDVPEAKVNVVLHPNAVEPANIGLARLLFDRQRQRAYTKATFKSPELDDEDLAW